MMRCLLVLALFATASAHAGRRAASALAAVAETPGNPKEVPPVTLPEQGYSEYENNRQVQHVDTATATGDWGSEYGPEAWWKMKGFLRRNSPSGGATAHLAVLAAATA